MQAAPAEPPPQGFLSSQPAPPSPKVAARSATTYSVDQALDDYDPSPLPSQQIWGPYPKTVIFGDPHWPWAHKPSIERSIQFAEWFQPEICVQPGDGLDQLGATKFPISFYKYNPFDEFERGLEGYRWFWSELRRRLPNCRLVCMLGNHDVRPLKRIMEHTPTMEPMIRKTLRDIYTFDGVETIHDPREFLQVGDCTIHHGYSSRPGGHIGRMGNNAHGHSHKGGLLTRRTPDGWRFELDVGYHGAPEAKAFTYTATKTPGWTRGVGALGELGPIWVPFE